MATCPVDRFREKELAISAANKALALDGDEDYRYIDTLAVAQANAGDFATAVESIKRAITVAPKEEVGALEQRLALFQAEKPFRQQVITTTAAQDTGTSQK